MHKVNSVEFNYQYRDRVFFPYSISTLVSHARTKPEISDNFRFEKTFIFRPKVDDYIQQCRDTDILLCSCYVWNWEITTYLAENVKKINPNCLVVFGGPQVPDRADTFFKQYPFVDILVHKEGEIILSHILEVFLNDKDYSKVNGLETKDYKTPPQPRMNDLNRVSSPYLTNLIWDLTEKIEGLKYMAIWETNRGCPYQCTFCDWGSLTYTKLRNYHEDRLFREIEWFADNKIPYVFCADANFGIFGPRDLALAAKMKKEKMKKGYPEEVRFVWAKSSSEKIIPIAKELQSAGLMHSVTLAVQSLNPSALDIIKRQNIKFDRFSELTETFRKNKIPTYTELIRGLPGETLGSFKKGLQTLTETQIGTVYIYNCAVFPNAPMNEPAYRELYKIKTVRSPIYLAHSSIHHREVTEYEDIIISASSFTEDDFKQMCLWSWFMQTFHNFGILENVFEYYRRTYDLTFIEFYEALQEFCEEQHSLFSKEYQHMLQHVEMGCRGKGWDSQDPRYGDLYWPLEELTWLKLVSEGHLLSESIRSFLKFLEEKYDLKTGNRILNDLIKWQVFLISTKDDQREMKLEDFEFAWKDFFTDGTKLKRDKKLYCYDNLVKESDPVRWGYEAIWWGRPSIKYKFYPAFLEEIEPQTQVPKENDRLHEADEKSIEV